MPSDNFLKIQQKIKDRVAFKAKYGSAGMRRLLPYVLGWKLNTAGDSEEVVLCYEFTNSTNTGWRCFKAAGFSDLQANSAPLPDPLPKVDLDGQNCVKDIEEHR